MAIIRKRRSLIGLVREAKPQAEDQPNTNQETQTAQTEAVPTEAEPIEAEATEPEVQAKPKRKAPARRKAKAAPEPEPAVATEEEPALPIERLKTSSAGALSHLPPMDAPAVNPNEPEVSYKLDFKDKRNWYASTDGGKTKTCVDSHIVYGVPVDLALQISAAQNDRDGFDQRLRLAFIEPDGAGGTLAELNLNAISISRDGEPYVTSGARSLVGALLAISESEEDMDNFCKGARFRVQPGTGMGVFVQVSIAAGSRWAEMSSALNTKAVPKSVGGFHATLAQIKQRFRACGHLLTSAAVTGTLEEWHASERTLEAVPIDVTAVIQD